MFDTKETQPRQFFEDILPLVQTPSHYLGSEINTVHKDPQKVRFKIALAFPDLYEIGMSHLGVQILYHILNRRDDVVAERVFAPRGDMEQALRDKGAALCALESQRPLARFDAIGFSLLYELNYTNMLNILELSGVPFYSRDRRASDPVVIAGGPCTFNPEPLADFFDAMVVGDGELVVLSLVDRWLEWKEAGEEKAGLLRRWSQLPGVYIPSFFDANEDQLGRQVLRPKVRGYEKVRKAVVPDLNPLSYPDRPVVPFGKPVHDRLSLEICRGCTRGCRFCQAGMIYRPVRERAPETILSLAESALQHTGYDDLSLLSLSTGDYCALQPLMVQLMARCAPEKVAVSLPSLRVGSLTESLMNEIKRVRKTGFTLAPEAGSSRLRDVINKNISEEDLMENVATAFSLGWRLVKLYFMVGLPTETDEDIKAILDLVGRLRKTKHTGQRRRDVNVSVSTFVPKAHTPFQWAGQISLAESREKIRYLRDRLKGKGLRFKWQNPEMSLLEGLWARGDRRLSRLLVHAFKMGCRFDGWSDQFDFTLWQKAMDAAEVDINAYSRARSLEEPLPWDHIDSGVTKAFLQEQWEEAMNGAPLGDCRQGECRGCGVCDFETLQPVTFEPDRQPEAAPVDRRSLREPAVFRKLQISYSKTGKARFFGHLEMVKTILRAFKRAGIRLRFTEGFHPSPKVSFSSPLPVGVESEEEFFVVEVPVEVTPEALVAQLNAHLPNGLHLTSCASADPGILQSRTCVEYTIRLKEGVFSQDKLEAYGSAASWPITRKNKKGRIKKIDLKQGILGLTLDGPDTLRIRVDLSSGPHIRPSEVLACVFALPNKAILLASIIKTPGEG